MAAPVAFATMAVRRKWLVVGVVAFLSVALVLAGWTGFRAWRAWSGIERIDFDPGTARQELPSIPKSEAEVESVSPTAPPSPVDYRAILAIGNDLDPDDPDRQEGVYADAVLLYLAPNDGGAPVLASLPRDLVVIDPCSGLPTKLDRTLAGCGGVSGAELVSLAVEDFTGIPVDHYATFGFEGFVRVIDAVGGVNLCVEHAVREGTLDLLPAGCSVADGQTALRWIRSRQTQELVDGEWRFVEGVSDVSRADRQQQLLIALLARLNDMRSPLMVAAVVEGLGETVVLDDSLSLGEAIGLAWDLRGTAGSRIRRVIVPTEPTVLDDGSFALRATTPFDELLQG